jgi:hypothetical protein
MALDNTLKIKVSNEPLKFKIAKVPSLFRDIHYQDVSYRLVILYAMRNFFKESSEKNAGTLLRELKNASLSENPKYYERHFVELYKFCQSNQSNKPGLLLVDRSDGCYALVLYTEDEKPDHGNRVWSFQQALDDLLLSHNTYDKLLNNNPEWCIDLVDKLRATFTYPEKQLKSDPFDF